MTIDPDATPSAAEPIDGTDRALAAAVAAVAAAALAEAARALDAAARALVALDAAGWWEADLAAKRAQTAAQQLAGVAQ